MDDGLSHVGDGRQAEENGEEICGWEIGAKGSHGRLLIFDS
jgi:hypothetical protein